MIYLKKYLTRDAPLIFIECWYDGGVKAFKNFFGLPFAVRAFHYKNGAFEFLTDYKRFEEDLPRELSRWVKKTGNSRKLELVHKALVQGLKQFAGIKRGKGVQIRQLLRFLQTLRPLLVKGFLGVYVTHHWLRYQDQFKQRGEALFDAKLIDKLTKWRNRDGHIFFVEGVNAVNFVLKHIELCMNWPAESTHLLTYKELLFAVKKRELPRYLIGRRSDRGFLYIKHQPLHDFSTKLRTIGVKIITGPRRLKNQKKALTGTVAYRGKRRGKVRIIYNHRQLKEMKQGEILVAPMTSPWYVPAMKKAAAVVTDEGGVGSHAAIIARELKKPCVIGTKNATEIFKDGDMVEVDAQAGIVRKLG